MKRCVVVRVSIDAVSDAMGLPDDHRVTAVIPQDAYDLANNSVRVMVEGPKLPELKDQETPPTVSIPLEL